MPRTAPKVNHLSAKVLRRQDIERTERLVHTEHLGLRDQCARESDTLPHATRQLLRIGILVTRQANEFECPRDFFLFQSRIEAALDEPNSHVFLH